jgi:hypothetical protein
MQPNVSYNYKKKTLIQLTDLPRTNKIFISNNTECETTLHDHSTFFQDHDEHKKNTNKFYTKTLPNQIHTKNFTYSDYMLCTFLLSRSEMPDQILSCIIKRFQLLSCKPSFGILPKYF